MLELISRPWPWWIAGPILGLTVPALLLVGGRMLGISSSFRHICAATLPGSVDYFRYPWRREGGWNLLFVAGLVLGGVLAATVLAAPGSEVGVSEATRSDLAAIGVADRDGLLPEELVSWRALTTPAGWIVMVGGGFLVGFGSRWAGGCTSGHAISGLAALQPPSLAAVLGFFAGGVLVTHLVLPWVVALGGVP